MKKSFIYFDNAATSFYKPSNVKNAVKSALENLTANPGRSGHELSQKVAQKILGHSSYSVTFDVYTHLDKQYPNIVANKLNEFICK